MVFLKGSRLNGARTVSVSLLAAGSLWAVASYAQALFSVNGTDVSNEVVDAYFNNRMGQQINQITPEQRQSLMAELRDIYILATQSNAEELATDPAIAAQLSLQRHSILAQAVASDYFASIEVTEEELLAEYGRQIEAAPPLQFKARHILVASQGEATEIIGELNDGADFATLAQQRSTGPSGPNGGDLGWFSANQMVAPFSAAVAVMEDGQYSSEPVQTQFGWHVILREESRESTPPTFESVRDQIQVNVQQLKFQDHMDELRAAAE